MYNILIYSALLLSVDGVKFSLETTFFGEESIVIGTTIMQKGEKIRIEETLPNSNEIGSVVISDGEKTWHIFAEGKIAETSLIRNAFEAMGINGNVIKQDIGKKSVTEIPEAKVIKQKSRGEVINYKDYITTESMGQIPGVIEIYDSNGKLQKQTAIKNIDEGMSFSSKLFDKNAVDFSYNAKESAKKKHFE